MANIKFTNFAHSLLAVGISSGDTIISVSGGHGARFPALGAGEYFYATLEDALNNREIVKVTAVTGDAFTVTRAQDNTTARAWNAGDTIALRLNAAAITDFIDTVVLTVAKTSSTGSAVTPSGTTAQRDGSPAEGYFRHNATTSAFEGYTDAAWLEFAQRTSATGSLLVPSGTTAERDGTPSFGYTRANSTLTQIEWWNGGSWQAISGVDLTAVATDIIPDSDSTRSLGSSAKAFADIFAGSIRTPGGTASVPTDTVVNGSAKAWVNFNGTGTVAIRAAFNVSSITDNGTGDYTVNFTTAMPDANYAVSVSANRTDGVQADLIGGYYSAATGSVRVNCRTGLNAQADVFSTSVAIFR